MSSAGLPEDLLGLARALARVEAQPPRLDRAGAVLALRARGQTLSLVAAMMRSIGTPEPTKAFGAHRLSEARTVLALLHQVGVAPAVALTALARTEATLTRGLVPEPAITDLLREAQSTPEGGGPWREVLAQATACAAGLEAIADPELPRRHEWELARDAAALTMMVSRLDRTLLGQAGAVLGPQVRDRLRGSLSQNQLRTAAMLVATAAAEHSPGTLPTRGWTIASQTDPSAKPSSGEGLAVAAQLLREHLCAADAPTPALVRKAAAAQLRTLRLAEHVLGLEQEYEELLARVRPMMTALEHVCSARHPQVLALSEADPRARGSIAPAAADRALAGHIDAMLASSSVVQARLRADPSARAGLREDTVRVCQAAPATVGALYDLAHAQLLQQRWATTTGPYEHHVQLYARAEPPRLLTALATAAQAAWRADGQSAPMVSKAEAARLCGVGDSQIGDHAAELERLGARTVPPTGKERWYIPIEALRAVGLNPNTSDPGPLTLAGAAIACGVAHDSVRRRREELRTAGATVVEAHPATGWQIPIPALVAIGFLPERLALEPPRTASPQPTADTPSVADILSNTPTTTAAHVSDLQNGRLEGGRASRRRREELHNRLGLPAQLGPAEHDVLTWLLMWTPPSPASSHGITLN